MIFSITSFTLIHVLLSVVGILSGAVVAGGLAGGRHLERWAVLFLVTTIATSATGFGFPFVTFLPSHAVGIISLVVLPVVIVAHYVKRFAGPWRRIYAGGVVLATYLNVFVLVVQLFTKTPPLAQLSPTQQEAPFAVTQALVLALFVWLGWAALRGFRLAKAFG